MLPSLESLRAFVVAARLLNFRKAAKVVALTPTAFGQRIAALEDQLGAKLFERTTRSVRLTEAGEALVPVAEKALSAAEDCLRAVRGERTEGGVDFVIGTRHELGLSWLLPLLTPIERELPWLRVHLHIGSGLEITERVAALQLDCAITSSPISNARLEAIALHREDYVFVASPKVLAERPFRRVADANAHVLLDTEPSLPLFRYFRDALDAPSDIRFARVVALGTIEAIRRRVIDRAGIAVLPAYLVADDLKKKRLVRVMPKQPLLHDYFRLVFRRDDPRRAVFETLARFLASHPLR